MQQMLASRQSLGTEKGHQHPEWQGAGEKKIFGVRSAARGATVRVAEVRGRCAEFCGWGIGTPGGRRLLEIERSREGDEFGLMVNDR